MPAWGESQIRQRADGKWTALWWDGEAWADLPPRRGRMRPDGVERNTSSRRVQVKPAQGSHSFLLTHDEYNARMEHQGGLCAICRQPESQRTTAGNVKPLAVDHDHVTNLVRGLLCHRCNIGLGYFKDQPERIRAAARYLDAHTTAAAPVLAQREAARTNTTANPRMAALRDAAQAAPERSEVSEPWSSGDPALDALVTQGLLTQTQASNASQEPSRTDQAA